MLEHSRLIGGVTVLLHQQRLGVNLPLRATGDADFGVLPYLLREPDLVTAIEARGYKKVAGNRWERPIDAARIAAVDLLIPTYRSRARDTVQVGDVVTTEVPGLAEALRRPGMKTTVEIVLTDGSTTGATVVIPDAAATLALKAWARTVRREDRDAEDLWRCLEIGPVDGVNVEEAARRRTRIRALHAAVAGGSLPSPTRFVSEDRRNVVAVIPQLVTLLVPEPRAGRMRVRVGRDHSIPLRSRWRNAGYPHVWRQVERGGSVEDDGGEGGAFRHASGDEAERCDRSRPRRCRRGSGAGRRAATRWCRARRRTDRASPRTG